MIFDLSKTLSHPPVQDFISERMKRDAHVYRARNNCKPQDFLHGLAGEYLVMAYERAHGRPCPEPDLTLYAPGEKTFGADLGRITVKTCHVWLPTWDDLEWVSWVIEMRDGCPIGVNAGEMFYGVRLAQGGILGAVVARFTVPHDFARYLKPLRNPAPTKLALYAKDMPRDWFV